MSQMKAQVYFFVGTTSYFCL